MADVYGWRIDEWNRTCTFLNVIESSETPAQNINSSTNSKIITVKLLTTIFSDSWIIKLNVLITGW